jgi:hypothetical protein
MEIMRERLNPDMVLCSMWFLIRGGGNEICHFA